MKAWNFKRSTANAQLLANVARERGMSHQRLLSGTSLSMADLNESQSLIAAADELQMIRNLLAEYPIDTGIGLETGSQYHLSVFGVWGHALASSRTVREAAQLSLAHSEMTFAFSQLSIEEQGDDACWYFDDGGVPADLSVFCTEREMVGLGMVAHDLLGADYTASRICFSYPAPPHESMYQRYFNGPLEFGAERNMFVLPRELFDRPLGSANAPSAVSGADLKAARRISDQVRDLLRRDHRSLVDMEAVASELCMTSRTLRRKLSAEGVTYRQLMDEMRSDMARQMLAKTRLSIDQIAERLSYADASSFGQAFRRLTGQSPVQFRKSQMTPR